MSHWISSIIKHCCLLHSKGRLPAPISPSEILLLPSNNLFHPQSCEKKRKKEKLKQWLICVHSIRGYFFFEGGIFDNCTSTYSFFFFDPTRFFQIQLSTCIYMCNVCTSSSILMWPPYSLSHGPCLCHSFWGVIDVMLGHSRRQRESICYCQPMWGFWLLKSEFYTKSIWWHTM